MTRPRYFVFLRLLNRGGILWSVPPLIARYPIIRSINARLIARGAQNEPITEDRIESLLSRDTSEFPFELRTARYTYTHTHLTQIIRIHATYVYMYIYIHIYVCIYIYIYMYTDTRYDE